jgi:cellulose synthase/poly-beta-1,6-N-acetylglucosamine synthase-like glycosyltransferase
MIIWPILFWICVFTLVYIYAGYPLLIYLLARLKKPVTAEPPGEWPPATILIAAYNEEAVIQAKLHNSLSMDYPREKLQVLVAADGSNDRTVELVEEYASQGIDLSYQPKREGKSMALNRAMDKVTGEIVLFSDANNMFEPDVLKRLVTYFSRADVGGVSGAKHVRAFDSALGHSEGLYWKYESFIKAQEARWHSCTAVTGEIFAVRTALYAHIPAKIINDDFYTMLSLLIRGYRVLYDAGALSFEKVSQTAGGERERRARMTAGIYQIFPLVFSRDVMKHPGLFWQVVSHKLSRPVIPFAMLGALLAGLLAVIFPAAPSGSSAANFFRLSSPWGWIFLGLQALFYLMAFIGSRIGKNSLIGRILYVPAFLVSSNFALFMGFVRFSRRTQQSSWNRVHRVD